MSSLTALAASALLIFTHSLRMEGWRVGVTQPSCLAQVQCILIPIFAGRGEKAPFLFVSSSVHIHMHQCFVWSFVSLTPEGLTRACRRHGLGPPDRQFNGPPKDMKVTNFFSNFGGRALRVKSKNLGPLDLGPLCIHLWAIGSKQEECAE